MTIKHGVLLVGVLGNNSTTLAGTCLAHKHGLAWRQKDGEHVPDWMGSIMMSGTMCAGYTTRGTSLSRDTVQIKDVGSLSDPSTWVIGGWDIRHDPAQPAPQQLAASAQDNGVLDVNLQDKLSPHWKDVVVMPAFHLFESLATSEHIPVHKNCYLCTPDVALARVQEHIEWFRDAHGCDVVTVVYMASTEGTLMPLVPGKPVQEDTLSPSQIYCLAAIRAGANFCNTAAQQTVDPGMLHLAAEAGVICMGNDLRSGQTKLKSVLMPALSESALRVRSVCSWNGLGNRDGEVVGRMDTDQFKSKQKTKQGVIPSAVNRQPEVYKGAEEPTNVVLINYVPDLGDGKIALDEWNMDIAMGGTMSMTTRARCEDSLLAMPIIVDQILVGELLTRAKDVGDWDPSAPGANMFFKAPSFPRDGYLSFDFSEERRMLEHTIQIATGMECRSSTLPDSHFITYL